MSDLIKRSDAIRALNREKSDWNCDYNVPIDNCIKRLNKVKSADRPQEWIPCSERLPEEYEWLGTRKFGTTKSDEVYVTFESPKGERFCKHLSFQNGELSRHDQLVIDALAKGSKPIAWMPLPNPWKGADDE